MELQELLDFSAKYAALGSSVQDQLDDLVLGNDDMNPNAIKLIKQKLGGKNEELDDLLGSYFDVYNK